jgi:hypothetical protein
MKYIYTHLGLGDHVICNGLIRTLIHNREQYTLFVKPHNKRSVAFMYKDLPQITFHEADDTMVRRFLKKNRIDSSDIIFAGSPELLASATRRLLAALKRRLFASHQYHLSSIESYDHNKHFDTLFYSQHNIPFSARWQNFFVERDVSAELKLFDTFGVVENNYVFVHDDHSRGYCIDENYIINRDLPIIRPNRELTDNAFDYCYLMQHSIESHFMDSSFRLIFDSLKLRNTNIFYHIHLRGKVVKDPTTHSHSILNFTII